MLGGDLNLNSDIDIGEGLGGSLFLGNGPQTDALPSIDDILNAQHDKGKKHGKDGKKVKKKDKAALWTGEDDVFGEDAEIEQVCPHPLPAVYSFLSLFSAGRRNGYPRGF